MNEITGLELKFLMPPGARKGAEYLARSGRTTQGRAVIVLQVEPEKNFYPHKAGDVFLSATQAAGSLVISPSFLISRLSKAKGAPATVRGVTFQYLTDYQKGKLNEPTI